MVLLLALLGFEIVQNPAGDGGFGNHYYRFKLEILLRYSESGIFNKFFNVPFKGFQSFIFRFSKTSFISRFSKFYFKVSKVAFEGFLRFPKVHLKVFTVFKHKLLWYL